MTEHLISKVGNESAGRMAVIAICTLTEIQNKAYATHLQFAYRLAKENPEFQFLLFTPYRMTIANFRSLTARIALEAGAEYVMFFDDDSVLTVNGSLSLFKILKDKIDKEENKHIISPITYVRGYPFHPMFFKFTESTLLPDGKGLDFYDDFKDQPVDENGLLEVAAIGCHTCLIKTEVFKNIEEPFFMTGQHNTEDVYFCMKCHDYIENIGIYVDTTLSVGHLVDPLWVDDNNVEVLRKFYEELKVTSTILDFDKIAGLRMKDELSAMGEDFEQ